MKPLDILTLLFLFLCSCTEDKKPKDEFFYVTNMPNGLQLRIEKVSEPDKDTTGMHRIYVSVERFTERKVVKYLSEEGTDGNGLYYFVPEFGIIYSKSVTWKTYKRLHSTNATVDSTINSYINYILTDPNLLIAGEESVVFNGQKIVSEVVKIE